MLIRNVKPGQFVCDPLFRHLMVQNVVAERDENDYPVRERVLLSDGSVVEAGELDVADHPYSHLV